MYRWPLSVVEVKRALVHCLYNLRYYDSIHFSLHISGLIGRSWAMLFAGAGYEVVLFDILETQVSTALDDINSQLKSLEGSGLLRGDKDSGDQFKLIRGSDKLSEAVSDAVYVQVCVFHYPRR